MLIPALEELEKSYRPSIGDKLMYGTLDKRVKDYIHRILAQKPGPKE